VYLCWDLVEDQLEVAVVVAEAAVVAPLQVAVVLFVDL
jgi:hypothetical protein